MKENFIFDNDLNIDIQYDRLFPQRLLCQFTFNDSIVLGNKSPNSKFMSQFFFGEYRVF